MDWEVSLQLSSAGPSNRMPPGWYFTQAGDEIWHTTSASASLYGNVGINGLDEWSVDKLGWYKSPKSSFQGDSSFYNGQVSLRTMQQIADAFQVNTDSCVNNINAFQVRDCFWQICLYKRLPDYEHTLKEKETLKFENYVPPLSRPSPFTVQRSG